jgi:type VI secretion system secreted protein VgrG
VGNYKQENRLMELSTPLGKDVLLLQELRGREGLSQMFRFDLHLLSEEKAIKYEDIVGKKVTITLRHGDKKKRYINGVVSRFVQGKKDDRFTHYEAEVVPALWFLTRTADCRIFQNKTVPDILKEVLNEHSVQNKSSLTGSYQPREYCVQYRESDFQFVSRLMEQYGIFYFFEHESDKHTMVLGDAPTAHKACPDGSKARYAPTIEEGKQWEDTITGWHAVQEMRTGKYSLTDYDFEAPTTNLLVGVPSTVKPAEEKLETYDYPGEYTKKDQGDKIAKIRMQEHEAQHLVIRGDGFCRTFVSGYTFDLTDHYRSDANQPYVLVEVHHDASAGDSYGVGGHFLRKTPKRLKGEAGQDTEEAYSNRFLCIPKKVPYRPPRVTPLPSINGVQPALVVGPSGNEIWVDKYGRVKVQFYWDRQGKKDENSSCWIRVSQPWAGAQWGAIWTPRIGQEVLVEFFEGDPDQPIITGRVYNAQQMPPYKLPDHQTRSTFKSRSSKGGGSSNYNEVRFEDKKGAEQLFLHAEKDMDTRVKNDSREHIGKDRHLIVKGKQVENVVGDVSQTYDANYKGKVGQDYSLEVGMSQKEKIGMNLHQDIGMNHEQKVGMKSATDAGMEIHLKSGINVVVEAGVSLTLKVGGNFVSLNPGGVFIQGTMVMINSGGAPGAGTGASPQGPAGPDKPDEADDGSKGTKM